MLWLPDLFQSSTVNFNGRCWSALHKLLKVSSIGDQLGFKLPFFTSVLCTTCHCPYSPARRIVRNGSLEPNPHQSFLSRLRPSNLKLITSLLVSSSSAIKVIVWCLFTPTSCLVSPLPWALNTSPRLHSTPPMKS